MNEQQIMDLIDNYLPHGSGIDCDWHWTTYKNGKVVVMNSIHCMNQYGFYEGYQDFAVILDPQDLENFRIVFTGYRRNNYIYLWRDYLEDTIASAIWEYKQDQLKETT